MIKYNRLSYRRRLKYFICFIKNFASTCIRVKTRDREPSTVLNTDIASCINILIDGVLEDSEGLPLETNSWTISALDLLRWYFFCKTRYSSVNFSRLMDVIRSKYRYLHLRSLGSAQISSLHLYLWDSNHFSIP